MKKNILKILGLTGAILMSSTTIFAAVPSLSVLIGNKAYDLDYANDIKNRKELINALKECGGGDIYVKLTDTWLHNETKKKVPKELIPMILYKDKVGKTTKYAAQDGEPIIENHKEDDKIENTNTGGIITGGSTSGAITSGVEPVSKEDFKIVSANIYLSNGEKIYASEIEDKYSTWDSYGVDVSKIGNSQILGLEVELPTNIKKFEVYKPASEKVALQREILNGKITIDCKDPEVAENDGGEPGVSLRKLQEEAPNLHPEGDKIEIIAALIDHKGNKQKISITIKVK